MSYNPTQWKDGDLVTSAKLNKLEQGVAAGGIQIIHAVSSNGQPPVLDKTWQEIYDGGFGVIVGEDNGMIIYQQILMVSQMNSMYVVITLVPTQSSPYGPGQLYYIASSPDDYPVWSSNPPINNGPSEDEINPNAS